jgi:hypothetical protein
MTAQEATMATSDQIRSFVAPEGVVCDRVSLLNTVEVATLQELKKNRLRYKWSNRRSGLHQDRPNNKPCRSGARHACLPFLCE